MPKKHRVDITRRAERDAEEIWNHIAADSPARADAFLEALEDLAKTLETFPKRCPLIPESRILGTEYRHLLHGEYRIIYRILKDRVCVLRMIHSARLLELDTLED